MDEMILENANYLAAAWVLAAHLASTLILQKI